MGKNHSTEEINEWMNAEVAEKGRFNTPDEVRDVFRDRKNITYVEDYSLTSNPSAILGNVYYQEVGSDEFFRFHTGIAVNASENSPLKAPQTLYELMVDSKVATEISYLPIVTASSAADKVFQVNVILNDAGQLRNSGPGWDAALEHWFNLKRTSDILENKNISTVSTVVGVSQFHITSKEFTKFDVNVKGGFFGVNVNGTLYTSNTTAQLKVLYGLSLLSLTPGKAPSPFKSSEMDEMTPAIEWTKIGEAQLSDISRSFAKQMSADPLVL